MNNKITTEDKSNGNWVIQEQSKVMEDKGQIATIFILCRYAEVSENFGVRLSALEPANNEWPVFTTGNVLEFIVIKTLDWMKRSKDAFDIDAIDARFFKNQNYASLFHSERPSVFEAGERTITTPLVL